MKWTHMYYRATRQVPQVGDLVSVSYGYHDVDVLTVTDSSAPRSAHWKPGWVCLRCEPHQIDLDVLLDERRLDEYSRLVGELPRVVPYQD